jgi:LacI family gluconate utilization system Gnt-I transcriptional repressor
MKPLPTMADVARLAGVSAMTVSRALRHDASVSCRTRARVLEVIDELGYVPDKVAGALSSGRSGLVAVVVPTLTLPLFGSLTRGLGDTLFQAGLEMFLGASDYDPDREERIVKDVLRRRPEAIAIAGVGRTEKTSALLQASGIPVVEFLDGADPPIDHLISVDPVAVAQATIAHFSRKGRRSLAILTQREQTHRRGAARVDALTDAAKAAGMAPPRIIRVGSPLAPFEQGARAAMEALDADGEVDALVCMNDHAAIGAVDALLRRGMRVPDDVAVFGFGDYEICRHVRPEITTVGFNPLKAGVEIGKIMLSALEAARRSTAQDPYRLTLDFEIVERASA